MKLFATLVVLLSMSAAPLLHAQTAITAAIAPDAELLGIFDFAALRAAPLQQRLTAQEDGDTPSDGFSEGMDKALAALGLTDEALKALVVSIDFDSLSSALTGGMQPESLKGTLAFVLTKPITLDALKGLPQAMGAPASDLPAEVMVAGQACLHDPTPQGAPDIHMTLLDGGTSVLLASSAEHMAEALTRAKSGAKASIPSVLGKLRSQIPLGTQGSLVLAVPESMRASMRESVAKMAAAPSAGGPMGGMNSMLMKLFQNTKSVGLSMQMTDRAKLALSIDLGSAADAQQAEMLVKNMLMPMATMQLMQAFPAGEMPPMEQIFRTEVAGDVITAHFTFTEKMILQMKAQQQAQLAAAPEMR